MVESLRPPDPDAAYVRTSVLEQTLICELARTLGFEERLRTLTTLSSDDA